MNQLPLRSATDPAELNVVCRTKPDLPNQTDSNAALLPYLTYQLGSAHEWSGVWNGPQTFLSKTFVNSLNMQKFNNPLFRYFYNHLSTYTKTIIRLRLGDYSTIFTEPEANNC